MVIQLAKYMGIGTQAISVPLRWPPTESSVDRSGVIFNGFDVEPLFTPIYVTDLPREAVSQWRQTVRSTISIRAA